MTVNGRAYFHQLIWMHLLKLVKTGKWLRGNIYRVWIHFQSTWWFQALWLFGINISWAYLIAVYLSVQAKANTCPVSHTWPATTGMFKAYLIVNNFTLETSWIKKFLPSWFSVAFNFQRKPKQVLVPSLPYIGTNVFEQFTFSNFTVEASSIRGT